MKKARDLRKGDRLVWTTGIAEVHETERIQLAPAFGGRVVIETLLSIPDESRQWVRWELDHDVNMEDA